MTNIEHLRRQLIAGTTAADGSKTFNDEEVIRELDRIVYIEPQNAEARDLLNKLRVLAYNGFYQQRKAIIDREVTGLNVQLMGMRERFLRASFDTEVAMWGGFDTFWNETVDIFSRSSGGFTSFWPELKRETYSNQALGELILKALAANSESEQAILHLEFGLRKNSIQTSAILMNFLAATRADSVNREQVTFLHHYLQLLIKRDDQRHSMSDLDGHLGEINKASTNGNLLARRILAELWLSGFNGRIPANPAEVISLHQSMKSGTGDGATQAYHQLMINRLTWLNQIQFFPQLERINAAMEKNRAKAAGSREHSYTAVSNASLQLCRALLGAKEVFLRAEAPISLEEQKRTFLTTCQSAISAADGVLNTHRGWKDTFAVVCNWIVWAISFGQCDYRAAATRAGTYNFFRPQTASASAMAPLKSTIETLANPVATA